MNFLKSLIPGCVIAVMVAIIGSVFGFFLLIAFLGV